MTEQINPQWSERLKRYDLNRFDLSVGGETLASWLSDDVGSLSAVEAWVEKIKALDHVSFGGYLGSGNSFHVRAAKGLLVIENQFLEEQCVLIKIDNALALLESFGCFLRNSMRGVDNPPDPIYLEFEMDGPEAMKFYMSTGFSLGSSSQK